MGHPVRVLTSRVPKNVLIGGLGIARAIADGRVNGGLTAYETNSGEKTVF